MIEGILLEGLIYGIMVLAVFITFRVLNFADMTVYGSFPLGAAIMAVCLVKGLPSTLAFCLAFFGGAAAGPPKDNGPGPGFSLGRGPAKH